jgi:hypothetical protein
MERRVLLAISLSFLVLFVYQAMFMPATPPATSLNVSGDPVPESAAVAAPPGNRS